jgi:diacylglycerol kinase (ATP)
MPAPDPQPDGADTAGVSPANSDASGMKSKSGFARILRAAQYSKDGFLAALRHEHAFRQEVFVIVPLMVLAVALPFFSKTISWRDAALLEGTLLLVLVVELLNSAIEACVDYISTKRHPLAKRAKDMGSAAVTASILIAALIWLAILLPALIP